ncbi:MAG: phosphotransferase [candidate division KSB1 bacterium]|nr:phosphotransferase [candidate division KSB1 bacterium]MDZ7272812.1 phosphotransferase [candidate division KSB1 bacterium]MDZ7284164.1 phosphotransferase [candidate division KSB1 bacterium]MDZ7297438.1 phosphotransferase [candidate division KSB1 bacterium]MDZ7308186.1 phosphotransferase [candidate division KSB1 bacterium]
MEPEVLLQELVERFTGKPAQAITELKAHGSDRRIFRLHQAERTLIGVHNADRAENTAFLEFSRHFRRCGLPVPEIYVEDLERNIYLEEDLGDTTLFALLSRERNAAGFSPAVVELYHKVVRWLPQFQIRAGRTLNYEVCYPRARFDKQSMLWDLNYFKYYFLKLAKIPFNEQELEDDFERFTGFLLQAEQNFFLYRDFQSRNIMVRGDEPYFIDYQGGRRGALQYDIASLLFDAKADLPFELREELLEAYLEAATELLPLDRGQFRRFYYGYVLIRIMQAMGAYGFRGFYERKTHFLQSVPYAIRNLEYVLRTADLPVELPALTDIWHRLVRSTILRELGNVQLRLTVRIQSFSYKNGLPQDDTGHGGGFVFDCRALPNPGRLEKFAKLTGLDPEVIAFLENEEAVHNFMTHVRDLINQVVENYQRRNFTDLFIAFGCTGGQHRSVYCANQLARHLREKYPINVEVVHRDL